MPSFRVEALERFMVRATYVVEARTPRQAELLAQSGCVSSETKAIVEGTGEWAETVSIKECRLPDTIKSEVVRTTSSSRKPK